jgi:ech hydrogenase subunit D
MDKEAFLARVGTYHADGWRLAIINTTSILPVEGMEGGAFDISWSFARDQGIEHIRERVLPGEEVPSISASFGAAFLYENEMRELFGVNVTGIALDLKGQLYKTSSIVPFAPSAIRARLDALGRADAPAKHEAAGHKA